MRMGGEGDVGGFMLHGFLRFRKVNLLINEKVRKKRSSHKGSNLIPKRKGTAHETRLRVFEGPVTLSLLTHSLCRSAARHL